MITRVPVSVLSAVLLGLSSCSGGGGGGTEPPPPTAGTVAGRVSAGTTNISGAAIALSGSVTRNTATDAGGQFSFSDLSPGAYNVALTLPQGFRLPSVETLSKSATVTAGQTTTVNWGLEQITSGNVQEVRLSGVSFSPSDLTVSVGTTVRWVVDEGIHTVTPDNSGQAGAWAGTGNLSPGQTFSHTFTQAGTFPYHCVPHRTAGMTGTIRVQ